MDGEGSTPVVENGPAGAASERADQPGPASTLSGVIAAVLPSALYRVALANGHSVLAGLDTETRKRLIRLTPGDGVRVRLSPYDFSRGRIVGRDPEPGGAA